MLVEIVDTIVADTSCNFDSTPMGSECQKFSGKHQWILPISNCIGSKSQTSSVFTDKPPAFLNDKQISTILTENLKALHAACEAFVEAENSAKINCALNANTRTYSDAAYLPGDNVYYKHQTEAKWRGPAKVLGKDSQNVLLKHGGY